MLHGKYSGKLVPICVWICIYAVTVYSIGHFILRLF